MITTVWRLRNGRVHEPVSHVSRLKSNARPDEIKLKLHTWIYLRFSARSVCRRVCTLYEVRRLAHPKNPFLQPKITAPQFRDFHPLERYSTAFLWDIHLLLDFYKLRPRTKAAWKLRKISSWLHARLVRASSSSSSRTHSVEGAPCGEQRASLPGPGVVPGPAPRQEPVRRLSAGSLTAGLRALGQLTMSMDRDTVETEGVSSEHRTGERFHSPLVFSN